MRHAGMRGFFGDKKATATFFGDKTSRQDKADVFGCP
jgi:hypothetical protein